MRWLALLLLLALPAQAATLYCSPSGGGSGADFNNLCTLPNTTGFTRGNLYIIVDGSYGSKTLSTAASGSSTIEIRKASAADSSVAGYVSTLHDGEATFGEINVATPYWIMNGMTRTETNVMEAPAGYGIRASAITADSGNGDNADFSQFSYMDIGGTWSEETSPTCANTDGHAVRLVYTQNDITFTRVALHNRGSNNNCLVMGHSSQDITFDHVDFYMGWGKAAICTPNSGQQRHIIRYSRFWNAARGEGSSCGGSGTGITTEVGTYTWDGTTDGNLIYGNVFYGTATGGRNAVINLGQFDNNPASTNCKVFNNTFVGIPETPASAYIICYGGSGNEARNNLFYNISGTPTYSINTQSHNTHITSGNPFISGGYPTTLDFRLSESSAARDVGTDVGSPYNTDPLGVTRGADGTYDAGAYEYDSGAEPPSQPLAIFLASFFGLLILGGLYGLYRWHSQAAAGYARRRLGGRADVAHQQVAE